MGSEGAQQKLTLRGTDLEEAEDWLSISADKKPSPTALQTQYISASRVLETRRQRLTLSLVSIGFVISLVLALFAVRQSYLAQVAEGRARQSADEAIQNFRIS